MAATGGGPLLLVGASGLAREVLALASEAGRPVLGVLDDRHADLPPMVGGVPVLGPVAQAAAYPDADLLLCIGPSTSRAAVHRSAGSRVTVRDASSTRRCATPLDAPSGPGRSCWPV